MTPKKTPIKNTEYLIKNYYQLLEEKVSSRYDVQLVKYPLKYRGGEYEFFRLSSAHIGAGDKVLFIRAGIHGDEIEGPIAILEYFDEIFDYAEKRDVSLIIYPVGNPSGFFAGRRYNIDNDKGEDGNNNFIYYELADGRLIDDLGENKFIAWYWSSDQRVNKQLPAETALMHKLLRLDPLDKVAAVLDLHSDYLTPDLPAAMYYYDFGYKRAYRPILQSIEKFLPLLKRKKIGAGYGVEVDTEGKAKSGSKEEEAMLSDCHGGICRHDGSLNDLFYRLGIEHSVCTETTGSTPIDVAIKAHFIWIKGFIDIINEDY